MSESNTLKPVTDKEEQEIRDEIDAFVQATGISKSDGCLHIASDGLPLCNNRVEIRGHEGGKMADEYVRKPVAVFPRGYRDICKFCGELWRNE